MRFTLQGRLEQCALICLRTPAAGVSHLLPDGLELATHGPWAFWNVAYGRLSGVRPVGVPAALGMSYQQVAYRLVVNAVTAQGDTRRGVYFVRSVADARLARWAGNALTDFNIQYVGLVGEAEGDALSVASSPRGACQADAIRMHLVPGARALPEGSCFTSEDQADDWLRCESLGLSVRGGWLERVEVERDSAAWWPRTVTVDEGRFGLFDALGLHDTAVERAIVAGPIDYRWRLGRRERLAPRGDAAALPAT